MNSVNKLTIDKFIVLAANKSKSISIKINNLDGSTEIISTDMGIDVINWMINHKNYIVIDFTYGADKEFLFEVDESDIMQYYRFAELFTNILDEEYNNFIKKIKDTNLTYSKLQRKF